MCQLVAVSSLLPTACSRRRYSHARFLIPTLTRTDPSRRRKRPKIEKFDATFSRVAHVEHGKQGVHRQLPSEERQSQCHRTRAPQRKSSPNSSVGRPERPAIYPRSLTDQRESRRKTLLMILNPSLRSRGLQPSGNCSRNYSGGSSASRSTSELPVRAPMTSTRTAPRLPSPMKPTPGRPSKSFSAPDTASKHSATPQKWRASCHSIGGWY